MTSLPLLLAAPLHAATVRVAVVAREGGAGLEIADAVLAGGTRRAWRERGDAVVEILDADGRVLARAGLRDPRPRDLVLPEGGGVGVVLAAGMGIETLPWPDGAVALRLDGAVVRPRPPAPAAAAPGELVAVQESGDSEERLDLVVLGDGYTEEELAVFADDTARIVDHVLGVEPFGGYTGLFNVWRVDRASAESGASHHEDSPPLERDTAYGCYYGCAGIERLICCDEAEVTGTAAAWVPGYDGVLVLVNDPEYGGSGGWTYATAYNGAAYGPEVAAHELGHSLVGLWDEYSYGYAASYGDGPNCSDSADDLPWEHWTDVDGVGAYATCSYTNYYRPTDDACMMRSLQDRYCPVCREQVVLAIYGSLPALVTAATPEPGPVAGVAGEDLAFAVEALGPDTGPEITWTLDGEVVGEGATLVLSGCGPSGSLVATVRDPTDFVREDPAGLLEDAVTWSLERPACSGGGDTGAGGDDGGSGGGAPGADSGEVDDDPAGTGDPGGCGCAVTAAPGAGGFLGPVLAWLAARRRRSPPSRRGGGGGSATS